MLSLIAIQKQDVKIMTKVSLFRPLFDIGVFDSSIYLIFASGDIEFLRIYSQDDQDIVPNLRRSVTVYKNYLNPKQLKNLHKKQIKDQEDIMVRLSVPKHDDHESTITSFDMDMNTGIFVTACSQGTIKVWNQTRRLIRQIKFPNAIQSVQFMSANLDLLVGHGNQVSLVEAKNYMRKADNFTVSELSMMAEEVSNERMHQLFMQDRIALI